jgi:flagellar biosynthetic protein FlhB
MALFDDSNDLRTERPTARRRRQARERGLIARSTELLTAARSLSIWIVLSWWFARFASVTCSWLRDTFQQAGELPHSTAVLSQIQEQLWRFVTTASWPLLITTFAILAAHFLQVGWLWRLSNLAPQASRISPASGLQRLLSTATAGRALAIVLKLSLILVIGAVYFSQRMPSPTSGPVPDLSAQLTSFEADARQLVWQVAIALVAFGIMDYGWQRWRFERSLRMTRDEVREELKEVEGNPLLKHQRRVLSGQPSQSQSFHLVQEAATNHSL